MQKALAITALLLGLTPALFAGGKVTITGKITGYTGKQLQYSYKNPDIEDRNIFKMADVNGKGEFTFTIEGVSDTSILRISDPKILHRMMIMTDKGMDVPPFRFTEVIISPNKTYTVAVNFDKPYLSTVKGDAINNDYTAARKALNSYNDAYEAAGKEAVITKLNSAATPQQIATSAYKRDSLFIILSAKKMAWAAAHPKSYASLLLLNEVCATADIHSLEATIGKLDKATRNLPLGKSVQTVVTSRKSVRIGGKVLDFKGVSLEGKTVSWSDFKGSWTLVEFWGSWCGPCRKSHPELIKIYNTFHSKGLKMISIAQDANDAVWKKAIEQDGTNLWPQLRSKKENNIVATFNINAFPTKLIVAPDGTIYKIKVGAKEGELFEEISKIFGDK